MKDKFVDLWEKAKDFVSDHSEAIICTFYGAYMIAIVVASFRSMKLFNQKTRLEIKNLSK